MSKKSLTELEEAKSNAKRIEELYEQNNREYEEVQKKIKEAVSLYEKENLLYVLHAIEHVSEKLAKELNEAYRLISIIKKQL